MRVRMQVYHAAVLQTLLYGCEAWAPSAAQLQQLAVFHHTCLRAMLGIHRSDRVRNDAVYQRCGASCDGWAIAWAMSA